MNARPEASVFFLVPDAIDDAERVSGGNVYDQRIRDGLRAEGWEVRMIRVAENEPGRTADALSQLPDGTLLLVDGLLATHHTDAIAAEGARLRLVVLAHMIAADLADSERRAYGVARRIIATSNWTRGGLIAQGVADPARIAVAHPGADPAATTAASSSGHRLLCVGTVAPHKGQDLLVRSLADCSDVPGWTCTIVGSLHAAPDFVTALRAAIASAGLADRIEFTGVLAGRPLEEAYGRADLVIALSRSESYGMVVAEALARGIPVLTSGVGGIPEAIAQDAAAMTVPLDDPWALDVVLHRWWASPALRRERKAAALKARDAARPWSTTTAIVASTLAEAALAHAGAAFRGDVSADSVPRR
ncbi:MULTISPECIES: glycosyltransferase family 4 protein [unclassified Leifsonia]|uniref:glycosyltransferase family 4 protein n=1 Tax=unclassified Leifsonia TaxID=2663824 RepID=UPI0008A78885|nr:MULTISPECIES: glycosyltransferase family 4 protein [unclassified Leifsonia]SEI13323.1 Glycosyl transferases group 1 [Leifsonia sp. CL154]SFL98651.1 Glycosyl transferases group 1 [Leifsonia sp. CL147]